VVASDPAHGHRRQTPLQKKVNSFHLATKSTIADRIGQHRHRIRDTVGVVTGILVFAIFIHDPWPLRILSLIGLAGAAVLIAFSIRRTSLLPAFGVSKPDRKTLLYTIPAIFLGFLLGILTRNKFGLSLLPVTIGSVALVAPCIGALEELVFRGYIQGYLQPVGRAFSIHIPSMAHTGYKLLVILSLSEPLQFNLFFLVLWTFIGGLVFGVLRDLARSSVPPVIAHTIFDVILYGGLSVAPSWVWS